MYVSRTRVPRLTWLWRMCVCAYPSCKHVFLFLSFARARAHAHTLLTSVWRKTGSRRIEQLRLTSNSTRNESLDTLAREFNLVPVYTVILSTREYLERLQGRAARCLLTTGPRTQLPNRQLLLLNLSLQSVSYLVKDDALYNYLLRVVNILDSKNNLQIRKQDVFKFVYR